MAFGITVAIPDAEGRNPIMLRITIEGCDAQTVVLEGRLAGDWVGELRKVLEQCRSKCEMKPIVINLSEVSGIDASGRELLAEAHALGAKLRGSGIQMRAICEEIDRG